MAMRHSERHVATEVRSLETSLAYRPSACAKSLSMRGNMLKLARASKNGELYPEKKREASGNMRKHLVMAASRIGMSSGAFGVCILPLRVLQWRAGGRMAK